MGRVAISVLLRVLLELSVDHYVETFNAGVHKDDTLAKKMDKVAKDPLSKGKIDQKQPKVFMKFEQPGQLICADTLNRYVHSYDFASSGQHLCAIWDGFAHFLVCCLNAK